MRSLTAILLLAVALAGCYRAPAPSEPAATTGDATLERSGPGFRSEKSWLDHYRKHRREFGDISAEEYLAMAQLLRDAPVGGPILEIVRADGVRTRFDRRNRYFGAYNRDGTIRTFFVPNDGERYFLRQATRRR